MSAVATDEELARLEPIMLALVERLDPAIAFPRLRAVLAAGGKCRTLVLGDVEVDVVALARFIRDWGGDRARVIDAEATP
jgi:hypothetical protein